MTNLFDYFHFNLLSSMSVAPRTCHSIVKPAKMKSVVASLKAPWARGASLIDSLATHLSIFHLLDVTPIQKLTWTFGLCYFHWLYSHRKTNFTLEPN